MIKLLLVDNAEMYVSKFREGIRKVVDLKRHKLNVC